MAAASLLLAGATARTQSPTPASAARIEALADSMLMAPASASGFSARTITGTAAAAGQLFEMIIRIDSGGWIPPHTHNVDKQLRVVRGVLLVGHGETRAATGLHRYAVNDTVTMRANTAHYEGGERPTILLLRATGPFTTTFIPQSDAVTHSGAPRLAYRRRASPCDAPICVEHQ